MDESKPHSLVFARKAYASLLSTALRGPSVCVTSAAELVAAIETGGALVAFVDFDRLSELEGKQLEIPVVAIIDDTLADAVRSLDTFPWLSHLVAATLLATPAARPHLASLIERIEKGPDQRVLGAAGVGRVALLANSSHREMRLERMREFFSKRGLSGRTVSTISDVAEELVTNALYDAPVEAGFFAKAVPRTDDVDLPPERACEISYGIEKNSLFIRMRDPFGALTRARLLGVLSRCNSTGVLLDESRGGAGLGLWRVFSAASTIAITVIPGRLTDMLIRIEIKNGRAVGKQLLAVHMFFIADDRQPEVEAEGRFAADHDYDLMDESFTILRVAN